MFDYISIDIDSSDTFKIHGKIHFVANSIIHSAAPGSNFKTNVRTYLIVYETR